MFPTESLLFPLKKLVTRTIQESKFTKNFKDKLFINTL